MILNFYLQNDVVRAARELLGKYLFTKWEGSLLTGGVIVETEAYAGPEDRASHAFNNRRTKRTEVLYQEGGVAYVYLCYGMHSLLNVVTNRAGIPHAVLIRALYPTHGIEEMEKRRKGKLPLAAGPGTLCQALNIGVQHNGYPLTSSPLWIEDRNVPVSPEQITAGPRIGIEYAKEHALLPWRFQLANLERICE